MICRGTDISKYIRKCLGFRDYESRLYLNKLWVVYSSFLLASSVVASFDGNYSCFKSQGLEVYLLVVVFVCTLVHFVFNISCTVIRESGWSVAVIAHLVEFVFDTNASRHDIAGHQHGSNIQKQGWRFVPLKSILPDIFYADRSKVILRRWFWCYQLMATVLAAELFFVCCPFYWHCCVKWSLSSNMITLFGKREPIALLFFGS